MFISELFQHFLPIAENSPLCQHFANGGIRRTIGLLKIIKRTTVIIYCFKNPTDFPSHYDKLRGRSHGDLVLGNGICEIPFRIIDISESAMDDGLVRRKIFRNFRLLVGFLWPSETQQQPGIPSMCKFIIWVSFGCRLCFTERFGKVPVIPINDGLGAMCRRRIRCQLFQVLSNVTKTFRRSEGLTRDCSPC